MSEIAMMKIDKGEEIAFAVVGGLIPGTGRYKFIAKRTAKKTYEWIHFIERENGMKERCLSGETVSRKDLDQVFEIMNRNLRRIFGPGAEMKEGEYEIRGLGMPPDKTVH